MGKYFGTDGFRGEANKALTAEHAYKIGRFIGHYFTDKCRITRKQPKARIVIGKDTRLSGYMFEYILAGAITASGADAFLLHVTTTPCVAYITKTEDFDCGIMISASHNPYYDNGIKLFNAQGEKIGEDIIELIESYIDKPWEIPLAGSTFIGKSVDYVSGRNRYMGYLISLAPYSMNGLRIGLDCANGSTWSLARNVFEALGARVYRIGAEPDGVNINRGVGSTDVLSLIGLVKRNELDAGFAFDGDGDRCICIDERGNEIDGDGILYICARFMKEKGELEGSVVTTVMSNGGLHSSLEAEGISCAVTSVGDRFVSEYMKKHGCSLGGEQSGHIIFSKYAATGDGILTALKLCEVMLKSKSPLSLLVKSFRRYPQCLVNIRVRDKRAVAESPVLIRALEEAARELKGQGRILLRASGTEELLRLMVECDEERVCRVYAEKFEQLIKEISENTP